MKELLDGNTRFVEGKPASKDLGDARRHELAGGQHPKAVVLSCSDSRVPPEHLFDQGLGDLFVVRLAGNVPEPAAIGSVEYAVEHLGVGLVVVLGHHACGAVKAAIAGGKPEGNIGVIVKDIAPAVATARKTGKSGAALEDAAVHENARRAAAALTEKSPVLKQLAKQGKLEIKVAVYDLETGTLEVE
jgi:carbonic anhydrase